ncbi:hypothetical protein LIA77_03756 [Sarocladium implicatum]|nr:hypothetical protein LIA77_03756 [Sarocladium implicatum]
MFDEVVRRRKAEEKDRVKKRLMLKYKQASAARKKRQFFAALSVWQESATNAQINAQFAADTIVSRETRQRAQTLEAWTQQSRAHEQDMDRAIQQYGIYWIDRWTASAAREAERENQAWETWAVDRQRTALKDWSILALQRGGQAHTASAAYLKHSRDRRRRILQLWKQQKDKKQGIENLDANRNFTPGPGSLRSYRQSWRFFSEKGHAASNRTSIMSTADTPTRWTGQLSLMSSTMGQNPMPAVDEADEPDLAKSPMSDGLPKGFDSPVRGKAKPNVFGASLSTTPLAPVPTHLHGRLGDGARPSPWPRSAYGQRSLYVPSKLGPTRSQRLFPRSVQQQSSDKFGGNDKDLGSSMFFPSADRQSQAQDTIKAPHLVSEVVTGSPRPATAPRPFRFSKSQPGGEGSPRADSASAED